MKKTFIAISLALFSCLILAACTANATSTQEIPSNSGKNQPVSTNIGQDTSDAVADENCLPGGPSDTQLEYWEIDEFEDWMEQQRDQIQKLADNKDKSFYYKDDNGSYVCREWTQEDVDSLYEGWQDQLALMKEGYHFTKSMELSNGGIISGAFDPETWNGEPASAPGSTIILYLTVLQLIWAILILQTLLLKLCRNTWSSKFHREIYHRKKRTICSTMVPPNNKFLTWAGSLSENRPFHIHSILALSYL